MNNMDMQKRAQELADQWYRRGKYMWAGDDMAEFLLSLAAQPAEPSFPSRPSTQAQDAAPHPWPCICPKCYAELRAGATPPSVDDERAAFILSKDLYELLLNVQNGIDSPGSASMANGLIRRLDKLRSAALKGAK